MNRTLRLILITAFLLVVFTVLFTACQTGESASLEVGTPPETTEEIIPEGKLFARCSEPEANLFSIQFVGVVPTAHVDYVAFAANKLYADGTRGSIDTGKIRKLHREITDADSGITLTSKNFGVEDGYLFQRVLTNLPTNEPGLSYEISAYYVIGDQKIYTAKQTFSIDDFLKEHILDNAKSCEVLEESPLIDVQKWVKYEMEPDMVTEVEGATLSSTYYLGASSPTSNGQVQMFLCYAVPGKDATTGIRYNLTETQGDNAGVSTTVRRVRTNTLYKKVISETRKKRDTLTLDDFGLNEGYLAVISFTDDLNTVLTKTCQLNLLAYYSPTAIEYSTVNAKHLFSDLIEDCVKTYYGVPLDTYTFIPNNYSKWTDFSEALGNATGDGLFKIRTSEAIKQNDSVKFVMQIACALPTRFAEKIMFVFSAYDKDGNPIMNPDPNDVLIPMEDREITVTTLYPSIFGNDGNDITSKDFGFERGYIMSMLLTNIEMNGTTDTLKVEAYYQVDYDFMSESDQNNTSAEGSQAESIRFPLASLTITIEELSKIVTVVH